jgi:hypothetical protein
MNTLNSKADTESLRQEADRLYTELTDAMERRRTARADLEGSIDRNTEQKVTEAVDQAGRTHSAILRLLVLWQPLTDSRREIVVSRIQQVRDAIELAKSPVERRR